MSRLRLKTLVTIIVLALISAVGFYEAALHSTNEVVRGIFENLSADALIIGFTVTVIDAWNKIRDHKYYEGDEQFALNDIQTRVFTSVAAASIHLAESIGKDDKSLPTTKKLKDITEVWYLNSKAKLAHVKYEKVTVKMASQLLISIHVAANDIDTTITRYEKSLEGESFKALREIHRKLDLIASPGLSLIADGVMLEGYTPSTEKLRPGGAIALEQKINELIQVAALAEQLTNLIRKK
jgi:hypothetical protein